MSAEAMRLRRARVIVSVPESSGVRPYVRRDGRSDGSVSVAAPDGGKLALTALAD
jgi:hypothetical protein